MKNHTRQIYTHKAQGTGRMLHRAAFFVAYSLLSLMMLTACSSDAIDEGNANSTPEDSSSLLHLRIATQDAGHSTRASWADTNATDNEMMNLWVVVIADASSGSVVKCLACRPTAGSADQEIDEVGTVGTGNYKIYSFANISVSNVCSLLGITASSDPTISSTPVEITVSGTVSYDAVAAKTVQIDGNSFDPTADDNGFGEKGIPMSNVQTVSASDAEKDLIVIRMLAKIEIQLFNESGEDITVQSVTLSDITTNSENNLKLLPSLSSGANTMDAVHKDIKPNLGSGAAKADYTYAVPDGQQTVAVTSGTTPSQTLTFYVNESSTPTNLFKQFTMTIETGDGERYALINDNSTGDWSYIARNDYRIIPVTFSKYKFELIPYDFPAIGVFPCSVKDEDGVFTFTFHDYGHFHLVPKISKKDDDGNWAEISYSAVQNPGNDTWKFPNTPPLSSYTDATKGTEATDDGSFYRSGYGVNIPQDGDEVGGFPVWYVNDGSNNNPQWSPDEDPDEGKEPVYRPFFFGYIADPGASFTEDKKIYHEFTVQVKESATSTLTMTYRFYMILDHSQMSYARGAHQARHKH